MAAGSLTSTRRGPAALDGRNGSAAAPAARLKFFTSALRVTAAPFIDRLMRVSPRLKDANMQKICGAVTEGDWLEYGFAMLGFFWERRCLEFQYCSTSRGLHSLPLLSSPLIAR